ncbi:hypothetical protein [Bradyrhizobium sp. CCBAU 65884]|uniref:hypothetical protein n=1 Tax=Bradyrhizobium sp. CCBAU 65884 TaxID=722477 RepID=UPI002305B6FE|nr:hypothetical protein [Bradyrhizobium sp. CCBAU 65884]
MAHNEKTVARRSDGIGWSLAGALGLAAVAFLFERTVAPDQADRSEREGQLPEAWRDASPAGAATEGGGCGRKATSPADIPTRAW